MTADEIRSARGPRLPLRVEGRLAELLGADGVDLLLVDRDDELPALRGAFGRAVPGDVCILLRVHARSGIPLAHARVTVARGEHAFETRDLTVYAMEGYAHLKAVERRAVEARVWSRRAYATACAA